VTLEAPPISAEANGQAQWKSRKLVRHNYLPQDVPHGQGKANFILDNLIASGKAKPMVIVMANGYARRAGQPTPDLAGKPFNSPEMRKAIKDMMSAKTI
jgi:hypothetical protein